MVSVIVPTVKGREGSLDELLSSLPRGHEVVIIFDENLPLAAKRNEGTAQAMGDYLLFVDDDNTLEYRTIDNLLSAFERENVGIVGCVACYADRKERVADSGSMRNLLTGFTRDRHINKLIWAIMDREPYEVDEVANAFMVKREVFDKIGPFDAKRFPMDLDEADFCYRAKQAGYKIMVVPNAIVYHKSATCSRVPDFRRLFNAYMMGRNKIYFQEKHLTPIKYMIYLIVFMPITIIAYILCLLIRLKPQTAIWFVKGVYHGIKKETKKPKGI